MNISGGEMKKRNTLRALGAVVIFAVVGLLSACESFEQYEPERGRIELLDMGENEEGPFTFIVIKSSKLPECTITWPQKIEATDNGRPFGDEPGTGRIKSTTTLIFHCTSDDFYDATFIITLSDDDGPICSYPVDSEPEEPEEPGDSEDSDE